MQNKTFHQLAKEEILVRENQLADFDKKTFLKKSYGTLVGTIL